MQSHDPSKSGLIQSGFKFRWRRNWRKLAPSAAPCDSGTSSVDGLHRREQQHVADGVGVGEQHDQAIHAEAEATRRGQDGLIRPSEADFRCAARVFAILLWCSRSAGRSLSGIPNASPEDEVHQTVMINRP